jgi:hypothetical protein
LVKALENAKHNFLSPTPTPTIAPSISNKPHGWMCTHIGNLSCKILLRSSTLLEVTSIHECQVVIILHACLIAYNQIQ